MTSQVSWNNVIIFLVLTFGLNWLLALLIYLKGGFETLQLSIGVLLQFYMLIPAFSAIFLQIFVFKGNFLSFKTYQEPPRHFLYFYLLYTCLFGVLAVIFTYNPQLLLQNIGIIPLVLTLGGLLFVLFLQIRRGTESFTRIGLSFGPVIYYFIYGVFFVVLYSGMTLLNIVFNLGEYVDIENLLTDLIPPGTTEQPVGLTPMALIILIGFQSIILGPFLGLLIVFGEEYGWRGYLQNELVKLGRIRGVTLVGLIWGVWHAPIIVMGHNYPGYPILGIVLMTLYTIGLGFILGLAYLQSRSIWLVAYLHALNNQVLSFLLAFIYRPNDPVYSFGIGIYGLVILGLVVLLLLRHSLWHEPPEKDWMSADPNT